MVALTRIYTRSGDDGSTGLVGNERRLKSDRRIAAIGDVDELNASIGVARRWVDEPCDGILARLQNDLFDLGADIATPAEPDESPGSALRVTDAQVVRLESEIDSFNEDLEPLRSFVLPGGSAPSSALHLARTVARRAERTLVALAAAETVNAAALRYLNRLSDLLFVMARWANDKGSADVLWVPGGNG